MKAQSTSIICEFYVRACHAVLSLSNVSQVDFLKPKDMLILYIIYLCEVITKAITK